VATSHRDAGHCRPFPAGHRERGSRRRSPRRSTDRCEPPVAEERVVEATGRGWRAWFDALDGWGAASRSHTEIARWLRDEHGVESWYSQSIALGYERARGLRAPGQRPDGFAVGASKTVAVPVERLFKAFEDESLRERWLPGAELRLRTATSPERPATTGRTAPPA
jgi:hypothetical protein